MSINSSWDCISDITYYGWTPNISQRSSSHRWLVSLGGATFWVVFLDSTLNHLTVSWCVMMVVCAFSWRLHHVVILLLRSLLEPQSVPFRQYVALTLSPNYHLGQSMEIGEHFTTWRRRPSIFSYLPIYAFTSKGDSLTLISINLYPKTEL